MKDFIKKIKKALGHVKRGMHLVDMVFEHGTKEDIEELKYILEYTETNSQIISDTVEYIAKTDSINNTNKTELLKILRGEEQTYEQSNN